MGKERKDNLCAICGGSLEKQRVMVFREEGANGQPMIVSDVPARVCKKCGHRWFSMRTVQEIEKISKGEQKQVSTQEVAVYISSDVKEYVG